MKAISILNILVLLFTEAPSLFSQKEDYHWILGYNLIKPTPDTSFGRCEFIFTDTSLKISKTYNVIHAFNYTNASIADSIGKLLFYTNGVEVYDRNYHVMPNGDSLNPGYYDYKDIGNTIPGGALILHWPEHENYYFIIHHTINRNPNPRIDEDNAANMLTTLVDMKLNHGLGDVVYKNKSVYEDSLTYGALTACRHANGRDWWILCPYYRGKKMFTFLLDPKGLNLYRVQNFPFELQTGNGQAVFSPNGNKYSFMRFTNHYREFFLCDFDRCTGEITNFKYSNQIPNFGAIPAGVAFSLNNKYLYISTGPLLYQLDMNDSDPFKNKIQIDSIDGYQSFPGYPSYFSLMQLAPNGKIYICNGRSPKCLSTIENPDLKGKACNVKQHNISIVANSTLPNFPNFRLGSLDDSVCDTLALGRPPIAIWQSEQDTLDHLQFNFIDHSLYEVREWYWDFGDPSSSFNQSNTQNPVHEFTKNGVYDVCLIVKNKNGADTLCRKLNIETVSSEDLNSILYKTVQVKITPNPCQGFFNINVINPNPENMIFQLYNNLGQKVKVKKLTKGNNIINTEDLGSGIYFISILEKGIVIKSEKLIKH